MGFSRLGLLTYRARSPLPFGGDEWPFSNAVPQKVIKESARIGKAWLWDAADREAPYLSDHGLSRLALGVSRTMPACV